MKQNKQAINIKISMLKLFNMQVEADMTAHGCHSNKTLSWVLQELSSQKKSEHQSSDGKILDGKQLK